MSNEDEDLALQTLMSVRDEIAPQLSENLLRQCFAIQKKYQFSDDRSVASSAMERLIDEIVNRPEN